MKRFQPLFHLLNLLVLQRTGMVGGMELGCFGVCDRNDQQRIQEGHLTSRVMSGTHRGWMRSISRFLGNGSMQLSLRTAARRLELLAQAAGAATIAGVICAADAANLRDRLDAGLSSIALQFSDRPSIKTLEPRLKGGGSRRLYVAST
ncbi:MAG: hypothetical protein ACTS2F_21325 [Thainema sp.]